MEAATAPGTPVKESMLLLAETPESFAVHKGVAVPSSTQLVKYSTPTGPKVQLHIFNTTDADAAPMVFQIMPGTSVKPAAIEHVGRHMFRVPDAADKVGLYGFDLKDVGVGLADNPSAGHGSHSIGLGFSEQQLAQEWYALVTVALGMVAKHASPV